MNFIEEKLEEYLNDHTSKECDSLHKLHRETYQKVLQPRMLSGHLQGRTLSMISKMIRPKNILEIGTYTGYSAICLAEGLAENGTLDTIDINEELLPIARRYFNATNNGMRIKIHTGDALEIIPTLTKPYDIVFIDADKPNYLNYYHLVIDKIVEGAYIIADNALWSGKVIEKKEINDKDTEAIIAFNKFVMNDQRVENVLLPIRDGLMLIRKKDGGA